MLNARMVEDDEPAASAPVVDKATLDRRALQRKAMKHFAIIRGYIFDRYGRPTGPATLDPNWKASPNGEKWPDQVRVTELSGPSPWENADGSGPGAWVSRGTGAAGPDLISLVEHLGSCDRKTATDWLRNLVDRCAEIQK
jgi:hypothetical protein